MGRLDAYGRITDRAVLRALNWPPGTRYRTEPTTDAVTLRPDPAGPITINTHHGLTIPAPHRHWSGLTTGQRVLLIADTAHQLLIIHTPAGRPAEPRFSPGGRLPSSGVRPAELIAHLYQSESCGPFPTVAFAVISPFDPHTR